MTVLTFSSTVNLDDLQRNAFPPRFKTYICIYMYRYSDSSGVLVYLNRRIECTVQIIFKQSVKFAACISFSCNVYA